MAFVSKPITAETADKAPWCFKTNQNGQIKPVYHTVPLDAESEALYAEYKAAEARMIEIAAKLTAIAVPLAEAATVQYDGESKPMIPEGFSCRVGFRYEKVSVWAVEGGSPKVAKAAKANPAVSWGKTPKAAVPDMPAALIRKGKRVG